MLTNDQKGWLKVLLEMEILDWSREVQRFLANTDPEAQEWVTMEVKDTLIEIEKAKEIIEALKNG